jgi:hypothetical protein
LQGCLFPPRSSPVPALLRDQTNSFQSRGHVKLWLLFQRDITRLQKKGNETRLIGLLYFSFTLQSGKNVLNILIPEYLIESCCFLHFCTSYLGELGGNIGPKICRHDWR